MTTTTKPKKIAGGVMIRYRHNDLYSLVYHDGKRVGRILMFTGKGWAYVPTEGERGEFFPERWQCIESIEAAL